MPVGTPRKHGGRWMIKVAQPSKWRAASKERSLKLEKQLEKKNKKSPKKSYIIFSPKNYKKRSDFIDYRKNTVGMWNPYKPLPKKNSKVIFYDRNIEKVIAVAYSQKAALKLYKHFSINQDPDRDLFIETVKPGKAKIPEWAKNNLVTASNL